ncbi:hypothetical protein AMC87_CH03368 [Rhizobium phaseoli]|nr:hypothetical protein AMC87_CH03368 [Rhizobium phaseoli]EGE57578.1 hypothetical protein RHECNPAF_4300110 [Rhizobium etli CNPAF512]
MPARFVISPTQTYVFAIDRAADAGRRAPSWNSDMGHKAIFDVVFSARLSMTGPMLRRSMTFYSNDLREICASR